MPKYGVVVWQMIEQVANELPEVFAPRDVIAKVKARYPQVNEMTVRCQLFGLTPNHPSSKYYSTPKKLFYYLGSGRFRRLGSADVIARPEFQPTNEEEESQGFTFSLESDLEDHLVTNLEQLHEGLRLYEEDGERNGRQYVTDIGRIDILAVDELGDFVVIELKMGGSDKSCGQLMRYMGWVKKHLAKDRNVTGMIIANKADDQLKYAASAMGNVKIKEYEVEFKFKDADLKVD